MKATDLEARLAELERRIEALDSGNGISSPTSPQHHTVSSPDADRFWLVSALQNGPEIPDGSVIFGGDVSFGGKRFAYQWQRPTHFIADESWSDKLERLAALAHPVRGEILRRLLCAPATAAELVEEEVVSSTGTAYHHLGALQSAGWVAKDEGRWSIRPSRVVPLMSIVIAAEDH
ncbi:helix-turn-helix transcriptional regulator [Corynebacterium sp.]|uniref:ArsR/SmtB family transcription factor n=1 Tax=Corynebacterium sp. TaxID=1720 RepID=UPI0026DDC7BF|nr:winged helix-turn-helix domain-containing protein [Corynebacterium sp.]MDO5032861.1 winged helix-turn-helix domain-containing protein [Corynebacterium sp.]